MPPYVMESILEVTPPFHMLTSFSGRKLIPSRDRCFLMVGSSLVPPTMRPTYGIPMAVARKDSLPTLDPTRKTSEGFAPYTGPDTEDKCVFPCVTFLYTRAQIDSQFSVYIATGLIGMAANFSLIAFDSTSHTYEWVQKRRGKRKKGWSTPPTFVVVCTVLGFLFGVIDTIPAAILKLNLPCSEDCIDEFCHGSGLACKVAQPSEYLLLLVFCVLLGVLMELYMKAVMNCPALRVRHVKSCYRMAVFAMMLDVVLTCVFADSDVLATGSDEYCQLIVSRDIFSCGPRLSSSVQELVFLTLPFMFVYLALVGFTFNMDAKKWANCQTIAASTGTWARQVCCCCCVNRCYRAPHKILTTPFPPFHTLPPSPISTIY
jgi:hypothetical protein